MHSVRHFILPVLSVFLAFVWCAPYVFGQGVVRQPVQPGQKKGDTARCVQAKKLADARTKTCAEYAKVKADPKQAQGKKVVGAGKDKAGGYECSGPNNTLRSQDAVMCVHDALTKKEGAIESAFIPKECAGGGSGGGGDSGGGCGEAGLECVRGSSLYDAASRAGVSCKIQLAPSKGATKGRSCVCAKDQEKLKDALKALADGRPTFASRDEMKKYILDELAKLPPGERKKELFVTLDQLKNDPRLKPGDFEIAQDGVVKAVNSLSRNADLLTKDELCVDSACTLMRFNRDDVLWGGAEWDKFAKQLEADKRPGAFEAGDMKLLRDASGQNMPAVRAEEFAKLALKDDQYRSLLGFPTNAFNTVNDRLLGSEELKNLADYNKRADYAGVNTSNVSRNNRGVTIFETESNRLLTLSNDYARGDGAQNIFDKPLLAGPNASKPAGGEQILELPNGLHAYALYTSKGEYLDVAPRSIVVDPTSPTGEVGNPSGCLTCHQAGFKTVQDQVRPYYTDGSGSLNKSLAAEVQQRYPTTDVFNAKIAGANERYMAAYQTMGIQQFPKRASGRVVEPWTFLAAFAK
jgi:hypothetical protein